MEAFLRSLNPEQVKEMVSLYQDYLNHNQNRTVSSDLLPWKWRTQRVEKMVHDAEMSLSRVDWANVVNSMPTTLINRPKATVEQIAKMKKLWDEEICGLESVYEALMGFALQYFRGGNPPLLVFTGVPGTGKTTAAIVFARMLGRPFYRVDCPQVLEGEGISGNRPEYNCSRPGEPITATIEGGCGNPVLGWDEFDKAVGLARHASIEDCLLSLTDGLSSITFKDNYLGFSTDLSDMWHIVICNETEKLSPALLSRANVIEFPNPTKDTLVKIVDKFLDETSKNFPHIDVEPGLAECLITMELCTTRDYKKVLQTAFGQADLKFLTENIPQTITRETIIKNIKKTNRRRTCGF